MAKKQAKANNPEKPATAQEYSERASRHRAHAERLRNELEQAEVDAREAARAERADVQQLHDRVTQLQRQVSDVESAATADEHEATRLDLIDKASEREAALKQLDEIQQQHEALVSEFDEAAQHLADVIRRRQEAEAEIRRLMDADDHRGQGLWRSDLCVLRVASEVKAGLASVVPVTAWHADPVAPDERATPSAWRHAARTIDDRRRDLLAEAGEDPDQSAA